MNCLFKSLPLSWILPLVCFSLLSPLHAGDQADVSGWHELFTPNLSNARSPGKWTMKDGILVAGDHRTLWTKKSYHNFILELDFKVKKESNSGVFLRSMDPRKVLKAMEIQVHGSTDGTPHGMVGALYDCVSPSKSAAKPVGEWNHYKITCNDNWLTVVFNGVEVIHADLNQWKTPHKNPDGSHNKFSIALKDYTNQRGPIGLQGLHGAAQSPVYYRNLRIKPLD